VTTEQTIVLGVLAAAFVAGWGVRALIGRQDDDRKAEPVPVQSPALDDLVRTLEQSREQLDRAIRSYISALTSSIAVPEATAERRPLADEVTAALKDDVANEAMIGGVEGNGLSERELDLTDWGFAYGVAWARVRDRRPGDPGEAVARDARRAAESVFRDYAADAGWARAGESDPTENGEGPAQPPSEPPG
jgi:hypothetical protein